MYQSALSASDEQATNSQGFNGRILTLLTSEELEQGPCYRAGEYTVPYAACEGCACLQSRSTPDLSLRHHCHAPPYQGTAPHFFRLSADEGSNDYMR